MMNVLTAIGILTVLFAMAALDFHLTRKETLTRASGDAPVPAPVETPAPVVAPAA